MASLIAKLEVGTATLPLELKMISQTITPPTIALIGISGYATIYVDWLLDAHREGTVKLVAFVALKPEQSTPNCITLKSLGCTLYESYESLFEAKSGKLDLCFIPTGIQWHARMAVAAMHAGCNVLMEKPLAGSTNDGQAIIDTEKATGHWVAVGFQDMYTDQINNLKQSLLDGRIGKVKSVSMLGAWPRARTYYERNLWAGQIQANEAMVLDSPLNNAFAHFVNLALFLAGETSGTSANAIPYSVQLKRGHAIESFDTAIVQANSDTDIRFWFGVTHCCRETIEPSIRVVGEKGCLEWDHEGLCTFRVGGEIVETQKVPNYAMTRKKMFESVIKRLSDSSVRICTTDIALCHTQFIESIHLVGHIQNFNPSHIEEIVLPEENTSIPAVHGIERKLINAFKKLDSLDFDSLLETD